MNNLNPNVHTIGKVWQSYEAFCPKCDKEMCVVVRVKEKEIAFVCRDCNIISNELTFIGKKYKIQLTPIKK